jgi:hypothetical protein
MIKIINIAMKHSKNVSSAAKSQERDYIKEFLTACVDPHIKNTRTLGVNSNRVEIPDFETRVFKQIIEFIYLNEFTLNDLYLIFYQNSYFGASDYSMLAEAKLESIDFLSEEDSYNKLDFARIKVKIENVDPIIFGLILEFIHRTEFFWNSENDEIVYPKDHVKSIKIQAQ